MLQKEKEGRRLLSMCNELCHVQKEVLEELQHHFPLDLLVDMSEAVIDTLQARHWALCSLVLPSLLMEALTHFALHRQWWFTQAPKSIQSQLLTKAMSVWRYTCMASWGLEHIPRTCPAYVYLHGCPGPLRSLTNNILVISLEPASSIACVSAPRLSRTV